MSRLQPIRYCSEQLAYSLCYMSCDANSTFCCFCLISVHGSQRSRQVHVILAEGVTHLDRDLVFRIQTENPHEPRVIVEMGDDGSVAALVTLAPQIELGETKCEIVFLIDQSGSMAGSKADQTKSAMNVSVSSALRFRDCARCKHIGSYRLFSSQFFLRSLPADCYLNIVGFGSSFSKLWPSSVKYSEDTLRAASQYCQCMTIHI
jgi:von Willebrand factor A domain-containing protein 5